MIQCSKHTNAVLLPKCIKYDFPTFLLFPTPITIFPKGRFVALRLNWFCQINMPNNKLAMCRSTAATCCCAADQGLLHNMDSTNSSTSYIQNFKQLMCNFYSLIMVFRGYLLFHKNMSRILRKPAFCICKNKDADQLRGNRQADQCLCFCYTDSTIPLLPINEISSLLPSSVTVQPGLCRTWLETPPTGFLTTRLPRHEKT